MRVSKFQKAKRSAYPADVLGYVARGVDQLRERLGDDAHLVLAHAKDRGNILREQRVVKIRGDLVRVRVRKRSKTRKGNLIGEALDEREDELCLV